MVVVSPIAFSNLQILKHAVNINKESHKIPVVLWLRQPNSISKERGSKPCSDTASSCKTKKDSDPEVL